MVSKFVDFYISRLFENKGKLKLVYSKRFKDILNAIDDEISKEILSLENDEEHLSSKTFIDIDEATDDKISFLITTKIKDVFDIDAYANQYHEINSDDYKKVYNSNLRSTMKINRFINEITGNKYVTKKLTDEEKTENKEKGIKTNAQKLNDFVNKFKSYRKPGNFEEVSGSSINYWYLKDNNSDSLEYSCMAGSDCQDYIDFYGECENVKLLILKDPENEDDDVIVGRALIWYTDEPYDRYFMDRIYTTDNKHKERYRQLFINYAIEHNYLYKNSQDSSSDTMINDPKDNTKSSTVIVVDNIKATGNYEFPYMDTLKYFSPDLQKITNSREELDGDADDIYYLEDTSGGYSDIGKSTDELVDELVDRICSPYELEEYCLYRIPFHMFWDHIDNTFIEQYIENELEYYKDDFDNYFVGHNELIEYLYNNVDADKLKHVIDNNNMQYDKEAYEEDYEDYIEEILNELKDKDIIKIFNELELIDDFCQEYADDRFGDQDAEDIMWEMYGSKGQVTKEKFDHLKYYLDDEGLAREYAESLDDDELRYELGYGEQ